MDMMTVVLPVLRAVHAVCTIDRLVSGSFLGRWNGASESSNLKNTRLRYVMASFYFT